MFLSGEEIYDNFQQGQGGAQLSASAALVNELARSYDEQADEIRKLVAITEAVWKGDASGAAQRGLGPLAVEHALAAPSLNTAQDLTNRQVGSFDDAKNRVIPVPPAPEKVAPLVAFMNPGKFVTYGQQLGAHNAAAQHNVDVMRGYEGASVYNMNMPDSYGQLSGDQSEIRVAGQTPNGPGGGGTGSTGGDGPGPNQPVVPGGGGPGPSGAGGQGIGPGASGGSGPGGGNPGGGGPGGGSPGGDNPGGNGPGGQGTNPGGFLPPSPPGGGPVGPVVPPGGGLPPGGQGPGFGGGGLPIVGPIGPPDGGGGAAGRGGSGSGLGIGPRPGGPGGTGGPGTGGPGTGGRAGVGPVGEPVVGRGGAQSGVAGRGGAAGMPFAPGVGKGRGGEDEEHERKSFLKEPDPESIFGTDEITAPPVIGGEP